MSKLSAGVARAVITPPIGVDLCGYAGRIPGCTGVHDDLFAKALVLADGKTKAAIITLDLIGLNAEQVAWIRQQASAKTGIPVENMLIGTSHTHAGPASQTIRACGYADDAYVEDMLNKVIDTVVAASKELQPVKFGFGTAKSDIAINRRQGRAGNVQIGENKSGPVDHEVGIWHFTDEEGRPLATIFNHACHAVVMGGDNRLVSADWPGAAQRAIETEIGGQAMFLQGCCGNINPRDRATFEVVEKTGAEVASSILAALTEINLISEAEIAVDSKLVRLPLQPPISLEEAERTVRETADALAKRDEMQLHEVHLAQAYHDWASTIVSRGGEGLTDVPFEVQRFSLDGAHIVGLPGEVFIEYALQIKKFKPNVFVAGYANGNVGYVPTAAAFKEGGYEVDLAYKLYGEQMLSPEVEGMILSAGAGLLNEQT